MFYHKDVTFTLTGIFSLQYLEFEPIFSRILHTMAIRVVEFSNGGYKIRKIFA